MMAAENDLISRTALLAKMQYRLPVEDDISETVSNCARIARKLVERATAVDAVEVVQCKDCKHWHKETGWCNHHSHFIKPDGEFCHPWESPDWKMFDEDDFCSYGERKE